jgi:sigma-E factor negative regulatory protein RseC
MVSSDTSRSISHSGIVKSKNDKSVFVSITTTTACSGCHAGSSCNLSGKEEKIVEVVGNYSLRPGDKVTVLMKLSMGYTAILFGYILPLLSVLAVLIVLISQKIPELVAGLTALGILIPYYIVLYFFRNRINEKFTFTLTA